VVVAAGVAPLQDPTEATAVAATAVPDQTTVGGLIHTPANIFRLISLEHKEEWKWDSISEKA
jgi:hypothetical protein